MTIVRFVLLAFFLSYGLVFGAIALHPPLGRSGGVNHIAVLGPALAALWMVRRERGSLADWLRERAGTVRWWWLTVPVAALGLAAALGAPVDPGAFVIALLIQTVFIALPEEIGWRGWLADRLLTRHRPIVAGLATGLIWGAWHGPKLVMLPGLLLLAVGLSVLLVLAYARHGGGIGLAALVHGSINAAIAQAAVMPAAAERLLFDRYALVVGGLAVAAIVARRGWFAAAPSPGYSNSTITSST
ncbi:CPBP family intramembrane glutamic endopeptidase [Sphingomicrobium astaxanthinifaciens]|uniref:CPBP family intramembrane glutamic endopeptidase n=1 Tax=Sphingomicrobium astaxanthinifaciens TaxID=1227949 RepID=UPI001FCC4687|nr:type II CAAX endopeptidase family protein [Sphingomicrobium astaxanthinifaciens]MCJ7420872.1 CPBP family intramembrane metalloprotease [Sphingomicrobium astaxanthinifaciens]